VRQTFAVTYVQYQRGLITVRGLAIELGEDFLLQGN
jgi:hypothetical protein